MSALGQKRTFMSRSRSPVTISKVKPILYQKRHRIAHGLDLSELSELGSKHGSKIVSATSLTGCRTCGGGANSRRKVLLVQSAEDLQLLRGWRRRFDDVRIRIAGMPDVYRRQAEGDIISDYSACGCVAARWTALACFSVLLLFFLIARDQLIEMPGVVLFIFLLVAILIPLAAMLLSIILARLRLGRTLDRLSQTLGAS